MPQTPRALEIAAGLQKATVKNYLTGKSAPSKDSDHQELVGALKNLDESKASDAKVKRQQQALRKLLDSAFRAIEAQRNANKARQGSRGQAPTPANEAQAESDPLAEPADLDTAPPPVSLPDPDTPLSPELRAALASLRQRLIRSVETWLLHRYATLLLGRMGGDESADHASFVNLTLQPLPGPDEDAPAAKPQPKQEEENYTALHTLLADHAPGGKHNPNHQPEPLWQLRGEPGAGKSTLLLDLELRQAHAALLAWQADPQARPELCVRLSLSALPWAALADLQAWVKARWETSLQALARAGHGVPDWETLHRRARVRLLLDGVNEVNLPSPVQRAELMRTLCEWATALVHAGEPAPVFTVRRLDWLAFPASADLAPARVADVEAWKPTQIQEYCALRFPGEDNPLWKAIDDDAHKDALLALFGNPFNLAAQCWLYARAGRELAANRGELMGRLGLQRLKQALGKGDPALQHAGLLTAEHHGIVDRLAAQRQPLAAWHHLALDDGLLQPGLQALALAMHTRQTGGLGAWRLHEQLPGLDRAAHAPVARAGEALHIISQPNGDGERSFSHHLWQEYLAACALTRLLHSPWPDLRPLPPAAAPEGAGAPTAALAPAPISPWTECAKLALQIAPQPTVLLQRLMRTDATLAAHCLLSRDGAATAEQRQTLKAELLARSTDAAVPLALRIQAAELLGLLGDDLRYTSGTAADGRPYRLPRGAGQGWIRVPNGKQQVGGLKIPGWMHGANIVTVTIPPDIGLAFAPVTNAEFRCFVEHAEGYGTHDRAEPPDCWQGEPARAWWRGQVANEGRRQAWANLRRDWLDPGQRREDVVDLYLRGLSAEEIREQIEPYMAPDNQAGFDAEVDRRCRARRERQPAFWGDRRYGNPLQPVVGVSVYEAEAYCRWLTARAGPATGQAYRLPTEAEWEVAARGGGARGVHWPGTGPEGPPAGSVNHRPSRVRCTTPVGVFPGSRTAEGWVDLIGNVWEWTASAWTEDKIHPDKVNRAMDVNDDGHRAVRGGSWNYFAGNCRAAVRIRYRPSFRFNFLGFRVVCCPIQEP